MLTTPSISIKNVANILAQCFFDDPSFAFILGDYPQKLDVMTAFFELIAADVSDRGKIEIAPDEQGACLWYPSDVEIFNEQFEGTLAALSSLIVRTAGEESGKRLEHIIQQIGDREPEQPHCEVFYIGLKPDARGKGIGKQLLKPALDRADRTGVGCYLISSNSRNISFYERQGFRQLFPIPIDDSYSMTGMWRDIVN